MSDDLSASKQIREGAKQRRARVLYSYTPVNDDELELQVNDIVKVIEEVEEGWWRGILRGKEGVFPSNFVVEDGTDVFEPMKGSEKQEEKENPPLIDVTDGAKLSSPSHQEIKPKPVQGVGLGNIFQDGVKKLKPTEGVSEKKPAGLPKKPPPPAPVDNAPKLPPKPVREQARVLYLYEAQNEDELSMKEGDIINIISKEVEDKGWWKGELNGLVGVFPDNFVELVRAEEVQLRRPERPEKPSITVLVAKNTKQDASEKPFPLQEVASAERTSKLPPPKPPAPFLSKKDEKLDKPTPPIPGKKPQLPPPMKKPNRSSLGPKPAAINVTTTTTVSSNQSTVQSPTSTVQLATNILTNGTIGLTDDMKVKSLQQEAQENVDESTFDAIESSPEKLTHLVANRAKAPNRRPPSRIFVNKENGKVNGDVGTQQPAWFKDASKSQNRVSSQSDSSSGDKETVQTVEDQKKDSPKRKTPTPVSPNVAAENREEEKTATKPTAPASPMKEAVAISPVNVVAKPEQDAKISSSIPDVITNDELNLLRKEITLLRESTASKAEVEELQKQIEALKEAMESQRNHFSKLVVDLISEIDEEKKLRLALEVQLDRIKKLTATV